MFLVYQVVLPNRSRKKVFVPLVELLMELKKKKQLSLVSYSCAERTFS
jgi:hypothetical protein